jgi:FMN phosphatase YigB (HAD superfamily)
MTPEGDQHSVRLICFDLGRVLVRICDGWRHACEVAGVAPPGELDPDRQALLHEAICRVEVGQWDVAAFAATAAPLLGIPVKHVRALWNVYTIGPYPGSVELLDELAAAGFATACLSNTIEVHWRLMSEPGECFFPLEKLTHRFASHLVRARKPDEAIYAHVERATGAAGSQIVFFDDLPENVAAAANRGWRAYRIDPQLPDPISQIRIALRQAGVMG